MPSDGDVAGLLAALREEDRGALDCLFPIVYQELRDRAHRQLAGRRPGDTLSITALVHEAYLKLTDSAHQSYQDRTHFSEPLGRRKARDYRAALARAARTLGVSR